MSKQEMIELAGQQPAVGVLQALLHLVGIITQQVVAEAPAQLAQLLRGFGLGSFVFGAARATSGSSCRAEKSR